MKKNKEKVDKEDSGEKKRSIKQFIKDIVKPAHMVVDFGNSSIKVLYGHFNKKSIEVFGHGIFPISKNLVDDGKILNPLEVASILRTSINDSRIKVKKLTLVLSGSDIIIREIQIPKADEKEVGKIIEFEAQQYFPIELTEYKLDYKILEEQKIEEEEKLRILLVAVPIEQIKGYTQVSDFLGINLSAIDLVINTSLKYLLGNNYLKDVRSVEKIELGENIKLGDLLKSDIKSFDDIKRVVVNLIKSKLKIKKEEDNQDGSNLNQSNDDVSKSDEGKIEKDSKFKEVFDKVIEVKNKVFSKLKKNKEGKENNEGNQNKKNNIPNEANYVLLDMGAKTTSIYVYGNNRLKFNRTLLLGSDELDRVVAIELTIPEEDARNLKINKGNLNLSEEESRLYEDSQEFNKALTKAFGNIMDDVGRFLEFYNSRNATGSIEKIYIYGGGSKLRGVKEYMNQFFNVSVEFLNDGYYKVSYTGDKKDDFDVNERVFINVMGGLIK